LDINTIFLLSYILLYYPQLTQNDIIKEIDSIKDIKNRNIGKENSLVNLLIDYTIIDENSYSTEKHIKETLKGFEHISKKKEQKYNKRLS